MQRKILIKEGYLYIPIYSGKKTKRVTFSILTEDSKEKVMEFMIPVDDSREEEYNGDYFAELPVLDYVGKTMLIEGDFPLIMGLRIENAEKRLQYVVNRPKIHYTADRGWSNDPNGMVYQDGLYHLFFQYNPFDTNWENMCWGHAVSRDMLHWGQYTTAMVPDEEGTIFSGCGLINEREMLGLPKDALLFYYTMAGGTSAWSEGREFTQKIAYSTDMGETLHKIKEPCIDTIYHDNRDPKIFWHEETQAYVMILWLRGNNFGILRSTDLQNWDLTQEFYLEDGWECPDLFKLSSEDGKEQWFCWAADGHYYPGEFDGYHFTHHGERHKAYLTKIPYAAQTFSGIEDRVITIPWLRTENDGRVFTGAYGIPMELSFEDRNGLSYIIQRPIREFYEQLRPVKEEQIIKKDNTVYYTTENKDIAFDCQVDFSENQSKIFSAQINGILVTYSPISGLLNVDNQEYQAGLDHKKMEIIVDDYILDIIFDDGATAGTYALKNRKLEFNMREDSVKSYRLYEID